jgi:alkylation response protein AidB-like acyl-CoA dehydrogenase
MSKTYGNPAPFAEPAWYSGIASPYYNESHHRVRDAVRKYLEEHIVPYAEQWEEDGLVPDEVRRHYARSGMAFQGVPREYSAGVSLPGGVSHEEWDVFHSVIMSYEINRIGYGGVTVGLAGGSAIGVPPVIKHGTEEQKRRWLPGLFTGDVNFCLGATEPSGESNLVKGGPLFAKC